MGTIAQLSDAELLSRLPLLVGVERESTADVVEHLVEVERRRLYLGQACSSLNKYCEEQLKYDEDGASKRARASKVALQFPRALEELRNGTMHLTSLVLLAPHLTEENAELLFTEASGRSRSEIQLILARRFPRPDVPPKIQPFTESAAGNGTGGHSDTASGPRPQNLRSGAEPYRLEPLSAERYRIEFYRERRVSREARANARAPEPLNPERGHRPGPRARARRAHRRRAEAAYGSG
jgi:hypothetical protein